MLHFLLDGSAWHHGVTLVVYHDVDKDTHLMLHGPHIYSLNLLVWHVIMTFEERSTYLLLGARFDDGYS
jgi:hypothetical protein